MDDKILTTQSLHNELHKLIGRFDVFQKTQESQNQKQWALDEKLVELTTQYGKEKSFSREPQNETQTVGPSPVKKAKKELEQVNTSITSLTERLVKVETSLDTLVQKIESVETSLKEDLLSLKQGLVLVTAKIEHSIDEVKDDIYRSKCDIFAVIEKEAQIVRDRIDGHLPSLRKYSFDFYVENFKTLVKSGKVVDSLPWHINELKTSMKGRVCFCEGGHFRVFFINSRRPREVGLQPGKAQDIKVKASICNVPYTELPDIVIGEETWDTDEEFATDNIYWNGQLGVSSCDDLINRGYVRKEVYKEGAILVRYDVTVL